MTEDKKTEIRIGEFVFTDFEYQRTSRAKLTVACNVPFVQEIDQAWTKKQKWNRQQAQEVLEIIKETENHDMYEIRSPIDDPNLEEFFAMGLTFSLTEDQAKERTKGKDTLCPLDLSEIIGKIERLK